MLMLIKKAYFFASLLFWIGLGLVKLEQFLMQKGMRELKKQQESGQASEELEHIVEALKDYDSVRIKSARVSSTMELVKYLTEYKSIIQEKTIRDIWDMDFK